MRASRHQRTTTRKRASPGGARLAFLALLSIGLAGPSCRQTRELPPCDEPPPPSGPKLETNGDPVVVGAGDIAEPTPIGATLTANLLDEIDGRVITLGDNAYINGTLDELIDSYDPTWGRHRWRTRPAVGNHEYHSPHAGPYYAYFCGAAGEPFKGYYSYDVGSWHVVVLNSQCVATDGYETGPSCDADSEQAQWLRADLAAHPTRCAAAYWHHPRFSSGGHGDHPGMAAMWRILEDAGVELVLSGHDHDYERFAAMRSNGDADPEHGIRQFVVGTGGATLYDLGAAHRNSEVRIGRTWGVIKLTLHEAAYDWAFIDRERVVRDSGEGRCH